MKKILAFIVILMVGIWIGSKWPETVYKKTSLKDTDTSINDQTATSSATTTDDTISPTTTNTTTVNENHEPVTFDSSVLTEGQKKMLETFGIDTERIEITAEMIECAETEVGKERMSKIIGGDTPTFLEGVALVGCYQ